MILLIRGVLNSRKLRMEPWVPTRIAVQQVKVHVCVFSEHSPASASEVNGTSSGGAGPSGMRKSTSYQSLMDSVYGSSGEKGGFGSVSKFLRMLDKREQRSFGSGHGSAMSNRSDGGRSGSGSGSGRGGGRSNGVGVGVGGGGGGAAATQ
mmetsp:Transcript_31107/g.71925  ORF Transcript_31107/g.71925 Transcript_31107/m.71925 type:complete len:150 (+) Transcript_31107:41-490(+)